MVCLFTGLDTVDETAVNNKIRELKEIVLSIPGILVKIIDDISNPGNDNQVKKIGDTCVEIGTVCGENKQFGPFRRVFAPSSDNPTNPNNKDIFNYLKSEEYGLDKFTEDGGQNLKNFLDMDFQVQVKLILYYKVVYQVRGDKKTHHYYNK